MTLQVENDTKGLTFSNKKSKWQEVNKEVANLLIGKSEKEETPRGKTTPKGLLVTFPLLSHSTIVTFEA